MENYWIHRYRENLGVQMANVTFTERAGEKIKSTVETVGRWTQNDRPQAKRRGSSVTSGRWLKIGEGEGGKYSWKAVKLDDEGHMVEDEDWGSGDHTAEGGFAVEVKSRSEYVLEGSIVWATPAPGRDCYIFEYIPGPHWVQSNSLNFPKRETGGKPGEYVATFLEMDDQGRLVPGQEMKIFNGYNTVVPINNNKWAQVNFGLEGKWWIQGADC